MAEFHRGSAEKEVDGGARRPVPSWVTKGSGGCRERRCFFFRRFLQDTILRPVFPGYLEGSSRKGETTGADITQKRRARENGGFSKGLPEDGRYLVAKHTSPQ